MSVETTTNKPSVLFVICDQLRADHLAARTELLGVLADAMLGPDDLTRTEPVSL